MTPALFLIYWLYQRNWRLLASTCVAGVIFVVGVPLIAVGPSHCFTLLSTWFNDLILVAIVENQWYPIYMNQSFSGVISRLFLDGQGGDILWSPDDHLYGQHGVGYWITIFPLSPDHAKMVLRFCQLAIVSLGAWAIGLKNLPREDGRRMLHYGLVVLAMMMINQRTWDHHAVVILIAQFAIWQAIVSGQISRKSRIWASSMVALAVTILLLTRKDILREIISWMGQNKEGAFFWSNVVEAHGPSCLQFILLFAVIVVLCRALKNASPPYKTVRQ